jgi:hypothetical protein
LLHEVAVLRLAGAEKKKENGRRSWNKKKKKKKRAQMQSFAGQNPGFRGL